MLQSDPVGYEGVAKSDVRLKSNTCDGIPKILKNDGPLLFSYNAELNEMTISGIMKTKHNALYILDAIGSYNVKSNGRVSVDMTLNLEGQEGEKITVPLLGLDTPIVPIGAK